MPVLQSVLIPCRSSVNLELVHTCEDLKVMRTLFFFCLCGDLQDTLDEAAGQERDSGCRTRNLLSKNNKAKVII